MRRDEERIKDRPELAGVIDVLRNGVPEEEFLQSLVDELVAEFGGDTMASG
jgi:hypothetical protein